LWRAGPNPPHAEDGRLERRLSAAAGSYVKLLDFGLAKLAAPKSAFTQSAASVATNQPTVLPLTLEGTILGTLGYMPPEQLEGGDGDARSDIFAFGAILFEMTTGRRAFTGKSNVSLMAAILDHEPPPISSIQSISPPALDEVARICLAKNPDDRWQSAADLLHALKLALKAGLPSSVTAAAEPKGGKVRERAAWAVAALFMLATTAGTTWWWLRSDPPPPAKVSFEIPGQPSPSLLQFALSPDGANFVAPITTPQGAALWLRQLDQIEGRTLSAAVQGGSFPFWSPDGRFIAFFALGKLNKIDLVGSPAQPLCDAAEGRGGTWNRDGVILFAPTASGPLFTVPAVGGIPVQVTELDQPRQETAHRHPKFLPDGEHFVFFVASGKPENSGIYLGVLGSKETTRLVASDVMAAFAPPDHLLFIRENTLMAQLFDPSRLELQGDPFPIAEDWGSKSTLQH